MSKRKLHPQKGCSPKPKKIKGKVAIVAALLIVSAIAGYFIVKSGQTADIWIGDCRIRAEIADTPQQQAKGLSGRKRLKASHGMVFVYDYSRKRSFWMKDTSIPLSIAFISHDGMIRQIEQMSPFDLRPVASHSPTQYVLEVNQGFFKENGITVGMHVDLTDLINK